MDIRLAYLSRGRRVLIHALVYVILIAGTSSRTLAVSIDDFANFANNLHAGRFVVAQDAGALSGSINTPLFVRLVLNTFVTTLGTGDTLVPTKTTPTITTSNNSFFGSDNTRVFISVDPQEAHLLSDLKVNGTSIFGNVVEKALSPENVLLQRNLPGFLGGSTFVASKAFDGSVLDAQGKLVPSASVGFGVFKTTSNTYFSPIAFVRDPGQVSLVDQVTWNLSPVVSASTFGEFDASLSLHLVAYDSAPEPSSMLLLASGFIGLVACRGNRAKG